VSGWDLGENYWCKNFKLIYRCEDSHLAVQFGQLLIRSRSNVSRDVIRNRGIAVERSVCPSRSCVHQNDLTNRRNSVITS